MKKDNLFVYFDNNATTIISPEVIQAMMPFLTDRFQNVTSAAGEATGLKQTLAQARKKLATLLGLDNAEECVFTSGATESNNWAIEGIIRQHQNGGHLVISGIEHPSLAEAAKRVEREQNWSVTTIKPDETGTVSVEAVTKALQPNTQMVSILLANSETGIIQPVAQIANAVKAFSASIVFHSDMTQAVGKIPISLAKDFDQVDLVSLSSHKFHGPKGCGVLVIREGINILPFLVGGGQENGWRSGTLNLPAIVGCGEAAQNSLDWLPMCTKMHLMRDTFETKLKKIFPSAVIFGQGRNRLPNTSFFALPGHQGNALADDLAIKRILVGTGSACSSGALSPPKSLLAMGIPYDLASSALRVSISRYTQPHEIDELVGALWQIVSEE